MYVEFRNVSELLFDQSMTFDRWCGVATYVKHVSGWWLQLIIQNLPPHFHPLPDDVFQSPQQQAFSEKAPPTLHAAVVFPLASCSIYSR